MASPFSHLQTMSANGGSYTLTAPTGSVAEIDVVTLGETDNSDCDVGVQDTSQSCTEERAIAKGEDGQLKGPWTIDDDVGIIITNNSTTQQDCSFLGKVL
jgi:hypothetical protein